MRIVGVAVLAIVLPTVTHAAVLINEVAWMGTNVSANAEWMELYNNGTAAVDLTGWHLVAGNGSPSIALAGSISAGGYFLLERTSDATVPGIPANQIYSGALTNSGTTLTLTNVSGSVVDQVDGGVNWANIGGDNASKNTAQRTASGWETAAPTPGAANAGVTVTPPEAPASPAPADTATPTSTSTQSTNSGGGTPEYIPIPVLRLVTSEDRTVSSGADVAFTVSVYDAKGNKRNDALVTWTFGDGMRRTGDSVYHAYYDPGEYLVVVHATTPDGGEAIKEIVVTVKSAHLSIVSVSPRGISVLNNGSRTLDLSLWRLSSGGKEFKIPEDTHILANHTILFPAQVIELPTADTAYLLYPSGEVAAQFPATHAQPSSNEPNYESVQAIASPVTGREVSITSTKTQNDEAVGAPTAATEIAAVGAASPAKSKAAGMFNSPWTAGLLGIIALAGGAFIFL